MPPAPLWRPWTARSNAACRRDPPVPLSPDEADAVVSFSLVCVWNGVPSLLSRSQSHFESAAEAQVS